MRGEKISRRLKRSRYLCLLSCALFAALVLSSSGIEDSVQSATLTTAVVGISPQNVTARVFQDFSLNVSISNVTDLYGWEFRLNWTAPLLATVNVTEGSFLKAGGNTFFTYNSNDAIGHMIVDCTLLGNVLGVSGDGVLATITFGVNGGGQSPLNLYNATLIDSNVNQIPCIVSGGYGYFSSACGLPGGGRKCVC